MRNDFSTGYLAHHGVNGQQWGIRNGPPYPLDASSLAKKISKNAIKNEPQITKDVQNAITKSGAKTYGLEHKLKTVQSITRKIETDSIEKKQTLYNAAQSLKDSVRYTSIANDKTFTQAYYSTKNELEKLGYNELRCRNYWAQYAQNKVKHKSVQTVWQSPNGFVFEIQFHTPSSQSAKDLKVPLYEERRRPDIKQDRAMQLEAQMDALAKKVTTPNDVYKIKEH